MGWVPLPPLFPFDAPPGVSVEAWVAAWRELAADPLLRPPMGLYDSEYDWDPSAVLSVPGSP